VYADRLAGGLPTVCSGLTRHVTSTPIVVGELWTLERCQAEEQSAMIRVQRQLLRCFTRLPPQPVFDAASSHAWNVGAPNTCSSAAMRHWNAGQWQQGCERMARDNAGRPVWSSVRTGRTLANGQPEFQFVQGLFNRRQDEVRWCLTGAR
jgi:GH24 family phage-related lysozyme (muramidase)